MNLQSSPPEKTIPSAAAEAMQHPVSAEKKGCIFYKLIGKSIIEQKELAIPKKFGRQFGDKLSDVVTLIDCNLTKSKIGLRSHNHRLWFHHGWPKFVEDHSIHAGSFLIFKYEGKSNFAVNVYELVESEMKSSFNNAGPSSEPAQPEPVEVDVDELIETHPNSKWKRRLISEPDGCLNKKKPRMDMHDKNTSFLKWRRRTRAVTDEERRCAVLAAKNFKSDLPFCRIMMRVSYVYYSFDLVFPSEFSNKYLKDLQGVIQLQDPNGRKWPIRCNNKGKSIRLKSPWRGFVVEHNLDEGDVCIFELVQRDDILLKVYIFRAANPEVEQASSGSMHKSTPPMVVDDQEVNSAQHSGIGTEDYANDFTEILNEDIDINVPEPQYFVPGCSKDNNGFAECMAEKTPSSITENVGWLPFEKTNDIEDYANDLMEKLNKDVDAETSIRVVAHHEANNFNTGPSSEPARAEQIEVTSIRSPQSKDIYQTMMLPSPSKTPAVKPFTEFSAEKKTSSVTADSTVRPVLEMRDTPAPKIGTRVNADELIETQPNSKWQRGLISELDACHDKKKPRVEVHDKKASFLKFKRIPREVTDEERHWVVLAAKNFKSDLPFCRIMMRESHVYYRFEFKFPAEFSKKHLKDIQGVIELQDPNGKKWLVRCSFRDNNGNARVTTGWRGFVVDNNLDEGDICIFELVQRDDIVLKVSIFRASESMPESTPSMVVDDTPLETREQEVNPAQHSGMGTEDYANDFMEILNEDIDINMPVPQYSVPGCCSRDNNGFAECITEKTSSNIAVMRDKPTQEIGIQGNADHLMETREEINNVYLANQPKLLNDIGKRRLISELGDCCNKKQVDMETYNKACSLKWKTIPRTVTDEEKRRAVHAAANFSSQFPSCQMVMQPSYVYSTLLFLPEDFSKKYLLGIQGPITLQSSNGRKWPAQCCQNREHCAIITTGWRKFVVDNNLDDGDVCIFELVQVENDIVVMKVSIFRAAATPEEEIVQVSGKIVPQQTEDDEQQVNLGQSIDIDDYANDFLEKLNKDVYAASSIRVDAQQKAHNFNTGLSFEPARAEQTQVTSIRSPQSKDIYQTVMLPSPSKTPTSKSSAEFSAEKTYSVTADSTVRPVLEMRDNPAPRVRTRVDVDKLIETQPNSEWKRRLLSELDGCYDKKKLGLEVHDKKASFLKLKRKSRAVTDEERKRVVLAARNFKSDLPFCLIMMRASHVNRFEFSFPSEFSKKHLKDIQRVIELRDPNGRKWLVRCSYKDYKRSARLTTGWRGFVVDNNLDDGDICIFELLQRDDIVLKVSILRAAAIPEEEILQASTEFMPKGTPLMFVDNIASERRDQEVNAAQHSDIGTEDYANDFMENEDIDIIVPHYSAPGCSKDNDCFAEFMAERTPSNIAGSVGSLPLEMILPGTATDEEKRQAVHEENTQDCKPISQGKNLEEPEILRRPVWHPSRRPNPKLCPSSDV